MDYDTHSPHHGHYASSPHHRQHSFPDSDGGHEHRHHHHHSRFPEPRIQAHRASIVCAAAGILAFALLVATHAVASTQEAPPNGYFIGASAALAALSFGFGFYAAAILARYRSARSLRRILFGLPVAVLTFAIIGSDGYRRYARLDAGNGHPRPAEAKGRGEEARPGGTEEGEGKEKEGEGEEEDGSVFTPGWYGEADRDGLQAVIASFPKNAAPARRFGRLISRSVSYATLTVMNLGAGTVETGKWAPPVLTMKDGSKMESLPAPEYLGERPVRNGRLLTLLGSGAALPPGKMLGDLPICMPPAFEWADVASVRIQIGGKALDVPGKMLTAEEKRRRFDAEAGISRRPDRSAVPAMKYYDNL